MPALATRNSKLATCRRTGATAVEFAIVAPIFFTLVIASLEFGRLNIIRHTADQAAYEAARFAMVPGATAGEARSKAESMLKIVGARDSKITIVGDSSKKIVACEKYKGVTSGEPSKIGSGPDSTNCLYKTSDITYR